MLIEIPDDLVEFVLKTVASHYWSSTKQLNDKLRIQDWIRDTTAILGDYKPKKKKANQRQPDLF